MHFACGHFGLVKCEFISSRFYFFCVCCCFDHRTIRMTSKRVLSTTKEIYNFMLFPFAPKSHCKFSYSFSLVCHSNAFCTWNFRLCLHLVLDFASMCCMSCMYHFSKAFHNVTKTDLREHTTKCADCVYFQCRSSAFRIVSFV